MDDKLTRALATVAIGAAISAPVTAMAAETPIVEDANTVNVAEPQTPNVDEETEQQLADITDKTFTTVDDKPEAPNTVERIIAGANKEQTSAPAAPDALEANDSDLVVNKVEDGEISADSDKDADESEQPSTPIPSGVYEISSALDPGKNVDIEAGSGSGMARADIYTDNSTRAQHFRIDPIVGTRYSAIYNIGSGLVLDVRNGRAESGAAVQQYEWNDSDAQKWEIAGNEDGSYTFFSALRAAPGERLALDVPAAIASNGKGLQIFTYNGTAAQKWYLDSTRTIEDGVYTISSGLSGDRVLDIANGAVGSGANTQVYVSNSTLAQLFYAKYNEATGYYAIQSVNSGCVLDVAGGSRSNGANVQQYRENGTYAQAWAINPIGVSGGYHVVSALSGLVLDVSGGSSANGANVQQYVSNGTNAQRWFFDPAGDFSAWFKAGWYGISAAGNTAYYLDDDAGKRGNYANIQLYEGNGSAAQTFEITQASDGYYLVRNARSGKYLTLGGSKSGANAYQFLVDGIPSDEQLWKISFGWDGFGFSAKNGLALDINGGRYVNGTNVQGYAENGTTAQRFRLHGASANKLGITDVVARVADAKGNAESIYSQMLDGDVYLFLPASADLSKLSLDIYNTERGENVFVSARRGTGYAAYSRGDMLNLSEGYVQEGDGVYRLYVKTADDASPLLLRIMKSSNIGAMFLSSDSPSTQGRAFVEGSGDHSAKAKGSMVLVAADGDVVYDGKLTQIKGRGNSTWDMDKKPYQIKLDKKTALIDGKKSNKAKTWVLLANAGDPTLMRNYITDEVAQALGLVETPQSESVDLYYDGEYRGTYLLSEKVEINQGRVDIDEIENDSTDDASIEDHPTAFSANAYGNEFKYVTGVRQPANITGGYLVELDQAYYAAERSWFTVSDRGNTLHFVLKSPEDASEDEVRYISEKFQEAFDHQNMSDADSYFDLDKLARVFLVEELAKNPDYIKGSSTYFYVSKNESLINAGPVWDFDDGYGIQNHNWLTTWAGTRMTEPVGLTSEEVGIALDNPAFRQRVRGIFNAEAKSVAEALTNGECIDKNGVGSITKAGEKLWKSQLMNQKLWGSSDYQESVNYLRDWLNKRIAWLDGYFNSGSWV